MQLKDGLSLDKGQYELPLLQEDASLSTTTTGNKKVTYTAIYFEKVYNFEIISFPRAKFTFDIFPNIQAFLCNEIK